MGTRHLIAVRLDGEYRIAQYGQWDGYPSGQGSTVLQFARGMDRPKFEAALRACSFFTPEQLEALGPNWKETHGHLSRDMGADILAFVQSAEPGVKLKNSITFAADSLFCEWAYVIDLDANTLEAFQGFNKSPLAANERFYGATCPDAADGYEPVRRVGAWSLNDLPTEDAFVSALEPQDESEAA